ncbi:MAG: gamma-glutamyl-gamma-aminobutyrate hydrolase family protein [Chloroflexi bacterium]|nr:gamma-glutamyl-gamma-aminobutyrate hydrolase family protein [Chloroflexota bacterium]
MKPRIALTLPVQSSSGRVAARDRYVAALEAAGAEVVQLEPGADVGGADMEQIEALCLSGGEDVEPRFYGAVNTASEETDEKRDAYELSLLRHALDRDLPVLGICRGFQVLNVGFGGSLEQHREGHRPSDVKGVVRHRITAAPGSLLAQAIGTEEQLVNSRHHQVVTDRELAPGLRPTARVGDLVEAFESTRHRFVLGVQWHPERVAEVDPQGQGVFAAFVAAAAARVPSPAG